MEDEQKTEEDRDDNMVFPDEVPDIGGRSFIYAFHNKKEWVEFTLSWNKSSGFFKTWYEYVVRKTND